MTQDEKSEKDVRDIEFPRKKDGTLDCEKVEGKNKQRCVIQKTKEGAKKNLKQAMGVPEKKKEAAKEKQSE